MLVCMGFYTISRCIYLIYLRTCKGTSSSLADPLLPSPLSPGFDSLKIFIYPNHTVSTHVTIFWIKVEIKLSLRKACATTNRTSKSYTNANRTATIKQKGMKNINFSLRYSEGEEFLRKTQHSSETKKKNVVQRAITATNTVKPQNGSVIIASKIHSKWWYAMNAAG